MIKDIIVSMRPKHWYKNLLLLVPIVFAGKLGDIESWKILGLAFIYFCLLTGSEYIINDIADREKDSNHPVKRNRPVAAGRLKPAVGFTVAFTLIALTFAAAYFSIGIEFLGLCAGYVALVLLYTLWLKHIFIADTLTIALGFVIRAVAGGVAIDVAISPWLFICTYLLAIFLAMEKRWYELIVLDVQAKEHRPTLSKYSLKLLEQFQVAITAATIVSYLLYTTLAGHYLMIFTAPFAIYGLLRYIYLVQEVRLGGEPLILAKDRASLINLVLWGALIGGMSLTGLLK